MALALVLGVLMHTTPTSAKSAGMESKIAVADSTGAPSKIADPEPGGVARKTAAAERSHGKKNTAAAEPSGYWTGPINSPVPLTLSGGTVIRSARQLRTLLKQGGAVVVDVSNAPRRPENLAPGAPWLPLPHRAIPGSLWIPGVGLGEIPVAVDDFYRQKLAAATGDHLARPLVIYCHESCWLSWNAAKRAISYGYRKVYWFREGVEGWRAAGYRTAVIQPQVAPEGIG